MFRGIKLPLTHSRNVYIPSSFSQKSFRKNAKSGGTSPSKSSIDHVNRQEAALLDSQLRELKAKQAELREKLNEAKDRELQKKSAEKEGANLVTSANTAEIAKLNAQSRQPVKQLNSSRSKSDIKESLPPSIRSLLPVKNAKPGAQGLRLFQPNTTESWAEIIDQLSTLPESTPSQDLNEFVSSIPRHQRSLSISSLEKKIPLVIRTQLVQDLFMGAYADLRDPAKVEELIGQSPQPTVHSFGNLVKALFRTGSEPEKLMEVLKRMKTQCDLEPSLPIMSTSIQSLIQHRRHSEAENSFDNLKYWSAKTQPDSKLYNSMILSAAKQHNVNRALDLFTEMKSRRPYPLTPDEETYNYMVYACSRSPETQTQAWNFFIEAQNEGFEPNRRSFQALLYLCGNSGEVLLARALVRNLANKSLQFVDDFVLNSLMASYRSWRPGPSRILASPTGQSIRASIMMNKNFQQDPASAGPGSLNQIPFLPSAQSDRKLLMSESNAIIEFFAEHNPAVLRVNNVASMATSPVIFNFLKVAVDLGDNIKDFKHRYNRFTSFDDNVVNTPVEDENLIDSRILEDDRVIEENEETKSVSEKSPFTVPRDQHIYRSAIRAAIKFKDLDFGREVWTERGIWRRKAVSFRESSPAQRNTMDFHFARDLVESSAVSGRTEEAIVLLKSAKNLKRWRKHHIPESIRMFEEMEDVKSLALLSQLLSGA